MDRVYLGKSTIGISDMVKGQKNLFGRSFNIPQTIMVINYGFDKGIISMGPMVKGNKTHSLPCCVAKILLYFKTKSCKMKYPTSHVVNIPIQLACITHNEEHIIQGSKC